MRVLADDLRNVIQADLAVAEGRNSGNGEISPANQQAAGVDEVARQTKLHDLPPTVSQIPINNGPSTVDKNGRVCRSVCGQDLLPFVCRFGGLPQCF